MDCSGNCFGAMFNGIIRIKANYIKQRLTCYISEASVFVSVYYILFRSKEMVHMIDIIIIFICIILLNS